MMEKLSESMDPDLAGTVTFSFHGVLKQKKLTNNRIIYLHVQNQH